tara:strand:+ start:39717 stop:40430 length:714 start_codon:yes stop_codon:yes gene_type:complete
MIHDHRQLDPKSAYGGGDARLIAQFTPLVRKLAWHLASSAGPSMDADDLMQIGLIALTECARRHDRPTDDGLAAYAKLRVRGAMIDAIRKMQNETRGARKDRKRIEKVRSVLAGQYGRPPTDAEMAEVMNLTPAEFSDKQSRSAPVRHVDMDGAYDESNTAFASDEMDAEDLLIEAESGTELAAAIAGLQERHQLVIQLYFLEELNLAEIAEVLEVSVPRVHQLKAAALKALRTALS